MKQCPKCKTDLTVPNSVIRYYDHKDNKDLSVTCQGHYEEHFEPDSKPVGDLSRCDLLDDSDKCISCGEQL